MSSGVVCNFSLPETLVNEFIPLVRYKDPDEEDNIPEDSELKESTEEANLSELIDKSKRDFKLLELTTTSKKIKLPFLVSQGRITSDTYGHIEPKLSIEDENIKIIGEDSYTVNLDETSEIEVEIEINKDETIEFYLEFYANDDDDSSKGICGDILCGKIKIQFQKLKKVFYAISLMKETDYRSNNFKYYRKYIKVKNSAFNPTEFKQYLSEESENLAKDKSNKYGGEEIKFLALFSHGIENNIWGDTGTLINKDEISIFFDDSRIKFANDAVIFLGACNSGTGGESSFAQKFADITDSKVIGMIDDSVAVVTETTGSSSDPKMIYGPKYGDKYNGKFYEFKKGIEPKLISKEVDIIKLVDNLKSK